MPVMDGYEATKRIREFDQTTPIIALTAAAMVEDREQALAAGMNDHLSKPIDKQALVACLERWLADKLANTPQAKGGWLIVEPNHQRLKSLAQTYRTKQPLYVANQFEKARQILDRHPQISQVLLASEWLAEREPLEKTYGIEVQIHD